MSPGRREDAHPPLHVLIEFQPTRLADGRANRA